MKIPEEKIQEIREATELVEVISQHVTLRKRGKTFVGLCPFHHEKTPSFNVDPARNFYHCFGCGAGGNVFTFLMQMEKISFPEAVRQLAQKAGIAVPENEEDEGKLQETEMLYRVNAFAAEFFQLCLQKTRAGQRALTYFLGRGFTQDMVETFQIGYAPRTWEGILLAAAKKDIAESALLKAGLVVESQRGRGNYDRFRGRLMFPIQNAAGRVVGFGGRLLIDDPKQPKYLNSPETDIYQKSRLVYGLHQAKTAIREKELILLVEGYTDVVRLHQNEIRNVVATSGTALTADQAKLLGRYAKRIALIYDGDNAGVTAAQRGSEVLLAGGLEVFIVPLPEGKDPDTYVKDSGPDALRTLLTTGKSFIDFRLEKLAAAGRLKSPADRASAARGLLETVQQIPDAIERDLSVKLIAQKLNVDYNVLFRAAGQSSDKKADPDGKMIRPMDNARQNAEKMLIRMLIDDGSQWADAIFHLVTPVHFEEGVHRHVAEALYQGYLKGRAPTFQDMLDQFSDQPRIGQYLSMVMSEGLAESLDLSRLGLDCAIHLRQAEMQSQIQTTREAHKSSVGEKNLELHRKYAEQKFQIQKLPGELEKAWKKLVEI